jgi:hypothetical protein
VQPAPLATQAYTILDGRVLGFAVMLAILTGIVFGVTPAVVIARGSTQPAAGRMRISLVALQAALSLILLTGSITMDRAFLRLLGTDLGFRTDHVVTMNISRAGTPYQANNVEPRYYDAARSRLRAIPGVDVAGAVNYLPLVESGYRFLGGDYKLDSGGRGKAILSSACYGRLFPGHRNPDRRGARVYGCGTARAGTRGYRERRIRAWRRRLRQKSEVVYW